MLRRVLVALTSIALTLGVVELALRIAAPVPVCDGSMDTSFQQTIPGVHERVEYRRDVHGLRRDVSTGAPALKILCLGASTTDQATQNWPDTWCARLARGLEGALGRGPIEAAAFGRGGMGVAAARRELSRLLEVLDPDLVVVLLGVNDITWLRGAEAGEGADTGCSARSTALLSAFQIGRRLSAAAGRTKDATTDLAPGRLEWHSENLPLIRERYRRLRAVDPPADPALVARLTRDLESLVADAAAHGAAVLLVGQPTLWKGDVSADEQARLWFPVRTASGMVRASPGWLAAEMRALNAAQRQLADAVGVGFVDLEPVIPKDLDHFFDDCHLTDRGSALVAERVLPSARRLLEGR